MTDTFVNTPDGLSALCDDLKGSPWLVVDTEFIREKTYYPRLCLIQVGNQERLACVDPLALDDLTPLFELLYNPSIVKVFHAADQDLEIFYHLRGRLPSPVFDTQPAAALLGYGEQIGYANLVKTVLNQNLDKSQTRTDWSRRPLSDRQIDYALDDVRYLRTLYETLRDELTRRGRLNWLDDDLAHLTDPDTYRVDQDSVWQRIKGANRLKGVRLNAIKHLARWREQRAIQTDRPRKWVLSDNVLLDLATQLPATAEQLKNVRSLDSQTAANQGTTLLDLIVAARNEPEALWPQLRIPPKPTAAEEAKADLITSLLHRQAAIHDLTPGLFATRGDIQRLVRGKRDIPLLTGWRRELAGEIALDILEGRKVLACEGDDVIIKPNPDFSEITFDAKTQRRRE